MAPLIKRSFHRLNGPFFRVCLPAAKKLKGMASTDQVNGDVQPLLIGFKQKQGDTSL